MSEAKLTENPFKILASRGVYENPWIEVTEHQVLTPTGSPGIYGVVSFKNRAVGVVPYEDGRIWLVGQYRLPLAKYSWEIPEGGSPVGEELLDSAKRELREETGLEASTYEKLVEMHLSNSVTDEYGVVYLARGLRPGQASPEETEQLQIKTVSLDEALQMVETAEITDSLSVAGLLKLALLRAQGRLD